MKLIKPSFKIIEQLSGFDGLLKQIEYAGRTCYKSEDKINECSANGFVDRMIKSGHGAVLEHGTVYLKVPLTIVRQGFESGANWYTLCNNPYTKYTHDNSYMYFTTNYRVIIENDLQGVLEYQCEPTKSHKKRVTVKFICDRGILAEFTRHRVFSFCAESTRYCDYSKDKFGNELTFIEPCWFNDDIDYVSDYMSGKGDRDKLAFMDTLHCIEHNYFGLLMEGWKPQQARAILPNSLKTELVMTGFVSDWKHFFSLRAKEAEAKGVHPQADELASPLYKEFINRKYI